MPNSGSSNPIVYPQLPAQLAEEDVDKYFSFSKRDVEWVQSLTYSGDTRVALLCLLAGFQTLGYFPDMSALSPLVITHIALPLGVEPPRSLLLKPRTLYRHHQRIRHYLGVSAWNADARQLAQVTMEQSGVARSNLADLINAAIEKLVQSGYQLPALSTLRRLAGNVQYKQQNHLFHQIYRRLSEHQRKGLDALLDGDPISPFARVCRPIGKLTRKNVAETIERYEWLTDLLATQDLLKVVPPSKREQWAEEARRLDANELKKYTCERRITYLTCLIHVSRASLLDALVTLFLQIVRKIRRRAVDQLNAWLSDQQQSREQLLMLFRDVLHDFQAGQNPAACHDRITNRLKRAGGIEAVLHTCDDRLAYQAGDWRAFCAKPFRSQRAVLLAIADTLQPQSVNKDTGLLLALQWILALRSDRDTWIKLDLDLSFLPAPWHQRVGDDADPGVYHRRLLEIAIVFELASGLRSGALYIEGAVSFSHYQDQLFALESEPDAVNDYLQEREFPATGELFVAELHAELTRACRYFEQEISEDGGIQLDAEGQPIVQRPLAQTTPASLRELEANLERRLPQRDVLEALYNADRWTGWSRHFRPPGRVRSQIDDPTTRSVLTAFTFGCGLGPAQASRHLDVAISAKQLRFVNRRHVGVEELRAACTNIIDQYAQFDLPSCWGAGESAAADGCLIATYTNNLNAQYHVRYQKVGGIAYRHVADNYIALFSHFIACGVHEAVFILDGVLKNTSSINPNRLHADTHGQSEAVFGLAYLLGIELMPRIRNWRSLNLYSPYPPSSMTRTRHLFHQAIQWDRIKAHWQDYLKLIMAIRSGRITPSAILSRLNSYSRKNPLYRALQELGRVIRTLYLLDWIQDETLRAAVTQGTNKVESFHAFAQHLNFGSHGVARTNDPIEQEKMTVYNQLVSNAVMLQNVVDQTHLLHDLHDEGRTVSEAELACLSPYMTQNLNRFGTYRTAPPTDAMEFELKLPQ